MLRLLITYLVSLLIFINENKAQVDTQLCPQGPTASGMDPNWRPVPVRFEMITELVSGNEVIELSQAFSTTRDSVTTSSRNGPIQFYWNFLTNEQFEVLNAVVAQQIVPVCLRQVITPTSETSVIQPNTLILKPSALLGYDARNQPNPVWGIQYDGEQELRGIPTSRFKSCFFVTDIRATVSATYYVSNVTLFQAYLPANISLILQLDVAIKNENGRQDSYTYNVLRYVPSPRRREERQALETPTGTYCPNRTPTLPVPTNIPDRTSANSELFAPNFNNSILSTHNLYDTEFQIARFDLWYPDPTGESDWIHTAEIHDFSVGLSYKYSYADHHCDVKDLQAGGDTEFVDGNPNLIQMGNPQHLFLLDDTDYQYTGEKRCRDYVWCHVWIGQKVVSNNTVQQREWYWASRMNDEELKPWIPLKLVIKQYVSGVPVFQIESNIFNFRSNPLTVLEIDATLADCYRALGPSENYNIAVLSFKINNDKKYPVLKNLNFLRFHIWETLFFALAIRPIRISNLIVDQDDTDIIVTFTLLDAPPRNGPVEQTFEETSLDKLIERLTSVIDSNALIFRARTGSKSVILRARTNSLNVPYRTAETRIRKSGPRIAGLWIGFIFVGLFVGALGGFFVFQKFAKA